MQETLTQMRANAVDLPSRFAPLGWDDTLGSDHLADVLMIAFTFKLGVRQHDSNRRRLLRGINQGSKIAQSL